MMCVIAILFNLTNVKWVTYVHFKVSYVLNALLKNVYDTNGYDSLAFMWICDYFFDRHAI